MKSKTSDTVQKVGFLVHPRDLKDFYVKFPYAKFLPNSTLQQLTKYLPPIKVSKITGLKSVDGQKIPGYVLSLPITAETILENRDLARSLIKKSVQKAAKLGIGVISLGGLTASMSRGGKTVADLNNVGITTGRAYTVKNITDYIELLISSQRLSRNDIVMGVVGAAGSIGSGTALELENMGINKFILIDQESKLDRLQNRMKNFSNNTEIKVTHKLHKLQEAHFVITATSAPEALVKPRDVQKGTFIIDDAQPSDIADDIFNLDGIVVLEAGAVKTPGISTNIDMGLQENDENYCCLVESLVLARHGQFKNFSIGRLSLDNIKKIEQLEAEMNFEPAQLQNKNGYIPKKKIKRVAKLIHGRIH